MASKNFAQQTYAQRAGNFSNGAAKQLLETMERKKSNLCVSVDVTKSSDFISVIETVGPYVALIKVCCPNPCADARPYLPIKTHIDVLDDFEPSVIDLLTSLSKKHDFLIFEDRKFADIGKFLIFGTRQDQVPIVLPQETPSGCNTQVGFTKSRAGRTSPMHILCPVHLWSLASHPWVCLWEGVSSCSRR